MSSFEISLEDGKYTYVFCEGNQTVLRYDEPWRDLTGDKFIGAMANEISTLRTQLAAANALIVTKDAELKVAAQTVMSSSMALALTQRELASKDALIEQAREALEEAEFADNSGGEYRAKCPWCGTAQSSSHHDTCGIHIALAAIERHQKGEKA